MQLRVHGVGGSTPEGLLGVPHRLDTDRVAGDELASFWARRSDPSVEGYVWGRLSTGDPLQPLWVFLLPFTFVNLAGWMHGPDGPGRTGVWRHRLHRAAVRALAVTLTMSSVVWLGIIGVDLVAWQWGAGLEGELPGPLGVLARPGVRVWLGGALLLGVLLFAGRVARTSQSGFEAIKGPTTGSAPPSPETAGTMADPRFWEHRRSADLLLRIHRWAAFVAWMGVMAQASAWAADGRPTLELGAWIILYGAVQFALLLILLVLDMGDVVGRVRRTRGLEAAERPADRWSRARDGWRFFGPTTAATLGVALSNGSLAGWEELVDEVLATPDRPLETGAELAMLDVGGLAALLTVIGVAVLLLVHWTVSGRAVRRYLADGPPVNERPPGRPLAGLPVGWRIDDRPELSFVRKVVRARKLSNLLRNADLAFLVPVLAFIVVGMIAGTRRLVPRVDAPTDMFGSWTWLPSMDPSIDAIPLVPSGVESWLSGFTAWLLVGGTWLAVAFLRMLVTRPATRQIIGTFWDVATFWPRQFHPLAVRPYASRAVPELQHRIVHHVVERGRPVVLATHSQGTVIALAALLSRPGLARGVGLVTMGSPLAQLYARFFPAWFGPEGQFERLRQRLAVANPEAGRDAWVSFFRETDYIGKRVFGDHDPGDIELDDPAPVSDTDEPDPRVGPDPDRLGWTDLARHSFYWNEPAVKRHLAEIGRRLALPAITPDAPDTPDAPAADAAVTPEAAETTRARSRDET